MAKSNQLAIEASRILKEYRVLGGLKDFKAKDISEGREHFFADKVIALSVSNINSRRRADMEARGRRYTWRDTYNPYNSTIFNTRCDIIKELTSEKTDNTSK